MSATPTGWWEFRNWRNAQLGLPPTPLEQATGPGLIDDHGMPDDLTELWSLQLDPTQPGRNALQADIDTIRAEWEHAPAAARQAWAQLEAMVPAEVRDEPRRQHQPRILR